MKVLYYCQEYYCNYGARTHAREFFSAFSKLPEVSCIEVFPKRNGGNHKRREKGRGKLRLLPSRFRRLMYFFIPGFKGTQELIEIIARGEFDCLLMRPGTRILLKRIKKEFPDLVICLEINGFASDEFFRNPLLRYLGRTLEFNRIRSADCCVVVSSFLRNAIARRCFNNEKILVNPNGVNPDIFIGADKFDRQAIRSKYNIPQKAFVVGYVGGMEPFRKLPEMIHMIARLRADGGSDLFLLLVGDGKEMPSIKKVIRENEHTLDGYISCLGWQAYEKVPELMSIFDIALFPFTAPYCSPLKLFEYLAMGIPTIGPDVPAIRGVLENEKHLLLVSQDGSDLRNVIIKLKNFEKLRTALASSGRRHVLDNFTWNQNAQRVYSHIVKCCTH